MLPEGGAMIILEYWCLDVFRAMTLTKQCEVWCRLNMVCLS